MGRGHPPGLGSGVAGHSLVPVPLAAHGAAPQAPGASGCQHRQGGIHCLMERSVIWSVSEFWEHLLSWIITCPVSCIPSMLPN